MKKVDTQAQQRLRRHLMQRHKVKDGESAQAASRRWNCTGAMTVR